VYSNGREGGLRIHTVEVRIFSRALNISKMARTTGKSTWEKYYKNKDGLRVEVKKTSPYYSDEITTKIEGNLPYDGSVIYRDLFSQHISKGGNTKIAFQFDPSGPIYYSPIDNFYKPGNPSGIDLSPGGFGLANQTFTNSTVYYQKVINSIADRWAVSDYSGELYDYLMELVSYSNGGFGSFSGIKTSNFDWSAITSYFAEVIGPLVCIKKGVLSDLKISNISTAKIFIPPSGTSLYDYKLIVGDREYLISAKSSKGVANQVKPQFILPYVDSTLPYAIKSRKAYKLLQILANYSTKQGPFVGWQLLQNTSELTAAAISDVEKNYEPKNKKSSDKIVNLQPWKPFLNKYFPNSKDVTYGQVRYKCETLISTQSKSGIINNDLKKIFETYLNNSRIIYVKMKVSMPNGIPSFSKISDTGVKSVNHVELRSSNDSQMRTSDRMGYDRVR
jgi:hypothetical protein